MAVLAAGLIAVGCGGDDDDEPATTTTATEETAPPAGGGAAEEGQKGEEGAAKGNADAGEQVFAANCASCHGEEGEGGAGPSLQNPQLAQKADRVESQVINGGGAMPPFGEQLSDKEIADVTAYVVEELAR